MKKALALVLTLALALALLAGCGSTPVSSAAASGSSAVSGSGAEPAESLGTVRYGIHQGASATQAGFLLDALELDDKHNFTGEVTVTTGPNVYSALAAGDMDIGYLGNGMGWHYFEDNAKIAILTIDNLTNDDRLLVRTTSDIGENEPLEGLYEKLPGKTLACDLTTTPGTFLKSLVNAINEGKDDADKIWYEDVEGAYPLKGAADKEIIILNTTNANITAAMQDTAVDCCICFANTRRALERDTETYRVAATTFTHLSNTITPSTWAVNKDFAAQNPELVQAFVDALVEAMDYRADEANWETCVEMAIPFDQLSEEDYDRDAAYWPTKEDLKGYWETDDSIGFTYLEQIRASHMGSNGLDADTAPQAKDVILVDFIRNATAD